MRSTQSIRATNARLLLALWVNTSANLLQVVKHVLLGPRPVQQGPIHVNAPMTIMVLAMATV